MPLEITFELGDADLKYFSEVMSRARERSSNLGREEVIRNARNLLVQVRSSGACEFIRERMNQLETLIGMVVDKGWGLEEADAQQVLQALSYFAEEDDLIPDDVPGLGFLDDAIMVELVTMELQHDIEAYRDFVVFRAAEANRLGEDAMKIERSDWLEERRRQLHARMQRRRHRGIGLRGSGGSRFSLFSKR